jgi:hypothetical protein
MSPRAALVSSLSPSLAAIEDKLPNLLNPAIPLSHQQAGMMLNKDPACDDQPIEKPSWLKKPETVISEFFQSIWKLFAAAYVPLEDEKLKDVGQAKKPHWPQQGHFWRIAAARRVMANWNRSLDKEFKLERKRLVLLVSVMAVALALYDNWFGSGGTLRAAFLVAAVTAVAAAWLHFRRRRLFLEDWVNDTRVISEVLRVQFFWSAAGLPDSAIDEYHPQAAEKCKFIHDFCCLVSGTPAQTTAWEQFLQNNPAACKEIMRRIRKGWLKEQECFFLNACDKLRAADKDHGKNGRFWLVLGFTLLIGRAVISPAWLTQMAWPIDCLWVVSFLTAGLLMLARLITRLPWRNWADGCATVVLGFVGLLALAFAVRMTVPDPFRQQEWFDAISGLTKTLALAYGTIRSVQGSLRFTRENLQRYEEMHQYMKKMGEEFDTLIGKDCTLRGLQRKLRQIGRAALRENAEWLQMHRDRPLDLFTPPT